MKSTYKLFGTIWDGITTDEHGKALCSLIIDKATDATLSFKQLLSANTQKDVDCIVAKYKSDNQMVIDIDYWCARNVTLTSFLEKRLCQMVSYLEKKYAQEVSLTVTDEHFNQHGEV